MFAKSILPAFVTLLATAGLALAQSPARLEQFKDWGAYSYQAQAGKVCYVLTIPVKGSASPAKVDHGDVFFLVTQRPGQNISYEPQAMVGYELKAGSKVNVTIDGKVFTMFTKGKSAWVENAAEEPALVAAMKSGHNMTIGAVSKKGTQTGYSFSLAGLSKALKRIETCQ
jgi:hypothetical protein